MYQTTEQQLFEHALLDLLFPHEPAIAKPEVSKSHRGRTNTRHANDRVDNDKAPGSAPGFPAVVIDHPTVRTIAVRWSDPRTGCYGEQIWRMCHSRRRAQCAATGLTIQPGDAVYRPTAGRYGVPFNEGQLILASAVSHVDDESQQ
ncbi:MULTISPECIES: DUF3331 domain-containing protein [unclassified Paraburkholderia]|uniref:DUF3331 domain-containing protein n=1 Tax=unclassified Paraburkholderia TaxID=2615204 RepID=UPI002AB1478E|nr:MULTISPECIES: DUF3331 domain-containing protein [unclassified Paraburkholderia]